MATGAASSEPRRPENFPPAFRDARIFGNAHRNRREVFPHVPQNPLLTRYRPQRSGKGASAVNPREISLQARRFQNLRTLFHQTISALSLWRNPLASLGANGIGREVQPPRLQHEKAPIKSVIKNSQERLGTDGLVSTSYFRLRAKPQLMPAFKPIAR